MHNCNPDVDYSYNCSNFARFLRIQTMKYKSICGRLSFLAMFVIVMLSVSCGGVSQGLLDSVPASTPMVASIDMEALLKQSGCRLDADTMVLTPELTELLADKRTNVLPTPVELLSKLHGAVDISHVLLFSIDSRGHDNLFMATISDLAMFENRIAGIGKMTEETDELSVYSVGDWSMAVSDTRIWLGAKSPSQLIEAVNPLLSLKADASMARLVGIADYLSGEAALKVAVHPSAINPMASGSHTSAWSCVSMKIENSVIGLDLKMMESDGKPLLLASGMQELDSDFLRYVPQSYVFAIAAGFTPEFKWQEIIGAVSLLMGPSNSSYISVIAPVLSKIDGTVAVAAGPAAGAPAVANIGLDTWDILVMVHLPQNDVDNALSMLKSYASLGGLKMTTEGNVTVATLPDGTKIYAGNVDGYLAVSNREFDANGANSMTDVFLSKQAAMSLSIPAGSEIVKAFDLPCGFEFTVQMSAYNVHARISLNGSDRRVLPTLMELAVKG